MTKQKILTRIQTETHQSLLILRNIEHLINTVKFEITFLEVDDPVRDFAVLCIKNQNLYDLKLWLDKNSTTDLEDRKLSDLRKLAGQLGICNYSDYTKSYLLLEIKRSLI